MKGRGLHLPYRARVCHSPAQRPKAAYESLVARARLLEIPDKPRLKDPAEFKLIGQPIKRLDAPAKVSGAAIYGNDVRVPDMLCASIERSPVFGGKNSRLDAADAMSTPGVRHVVSLQGFGHHRRRSW